GEVAIAEGVLVTAGTEKGVQTAALANVVTIGDITASAVIFEQGNPISEKDITIPFSVAPSGVKIGSAQVDLFKDDELLETLPADMTGPDGWAVWPARRLVDLKATYFAQAVIDPGTERELRSPIRQVPVVHLVFIDKRGEETFAPLTSDPRPVVTLDEVTREDVALLANGEQARVTVSGEVTDAIADIVADHLADITEVLVEDQPVAVVPVPEPTSVLRPFAFRGRFSTTVTVDIGDGANTVVAEAENAIGNKGFDSFTINVQQSVSLPEVLPTGNVYDVKFLDPFTLVIQRLSSDTVDSVVLFHGTTVPAGTETPLVETEPNSLVFAGTTDELGSTTLTLEAPLLVNDPFIQDSIGGTLSTLGLAIVEQPFEFVETSSDSGLFRNPALRLPNNELLDVRLDQPLDDSTVDSLEVKLGFDLDEDPATLQETAPDSLLFIGQVTGLGDTRMHIRAIEALPAEPDTMLAFLDSSELALSAYYLKLLETANETLRFQTQRQGAASVLLPPTEPTQATLLGVENHLGADEGIFEPVWVVARGLASFQPGDQGEISSTPFALTSQPPPVPAAATARQPAVRFEEPVLFVPEMEQREISNVLTGLDNPRAADRTELKPRLYGFALSAPSRHLVGRRPSGSAVLSKLVAIRGRRMVLTNSFITGGPQKNAVQSIAVSGGDVTVGVETRQTISVPGTRGDVFEVRTTFSVEVDAKAVPGSRDLTFRFFNGETKTFPGSFTVSRGRTVIFAIDGLSWTQFDNVVEDTQPLLDAANPARGTALNAIFNSETSQKV
ncbi:MAG: hypothetical protein ACE5JI_16865, partial [Acidobacteriota bacterium]